MELTVSTAKIALLEEGYKEEEVEALHKAKEAQDDLVEVKEELHLVMVAPPSLLLPV